MSKATTHQELEGAVANADRYRGLLASRQAHLARAQAALESSHAVLEAQKTARGAQYERRRVPGGYSGQKGRHHCAEVNLGYTRILAPATGAVGERHVQEGQLVAPGMQVIDLVRGDVWIQANYKETQLTNIQKGDVADITIDTFPGVVLHGRVAEISPSGSHFVLCPGQRDWKLHQGGATNPGKLCSTWIILCRAGRGLASPRR